MWGVTTQDSASKSNTDWMMDLKKTSENRGLDPSLLSILEILPRYVDILQVSRGSAIGGG